MSFEHTLVSSLDFDKGLKYVDDFAIDFAREVCDVLNAKFVRRDTKSLHIYRDGETYTLGWVGYGRFRKSGNTNHFTVSSRLVKNEKYNDYSKQHYMVMSQNIDPAMRNAKRYLRTYNVTERCRTIATVARSEVQSIAYDADVEARKARGALFDGYDRNNLSKSPLAEEFRAILSSGYQFVNSQVKQEMITFLENCDKAYRLQQRAIPAYFVSITERRDVQQYEVVAVDNIAAYDLKYGDSATYTDDTLPAKLLGKLSILTMLERNQFVDGVGHKGDGNMFFVVRDDEE